MLQSAHYALGFVLRCLCMKKGHIHALKMLFQILKECKKGKQKPTKLHTAVPYLKSIFEHKMLSQGENEMCNHLKTSKVLSS